MFEGEDKMLLRLNTALVGWKSPQMLALVSELPVKTNRMCLWLLLGLSTKPSSMGCIQREWPHQGDSESADTVGGRVGAGALCRAQGYHSASSSSLNSFPGSAGHGRRVWARAVACQAHTSWDSRVILRDQWRGTVRRQPGLCGEMSSSWTSI